MDPSRAVRDSEPLTLTVEEAAARLRIGRASAYAAARRGDLPGVFRIGRRLLVSKRALEAALDRWPGQDTRAGASSTSAHGA
jgi:excisionase family DNA binding protein